MVDSFMPFVLAYFRFPLGKYRFTTKEDELVFGVLFFFLFTVYSGVLSASHFVVFLVFFYTVLFVIG